MAASANQEGVEGTDCGEIWIVTNACVILGVCPPCQELLIFLPSKETHFGRFYNDFPPSVCKRLHTDRLLLSRCASRGQVVWQGISTTIIPMWKISSLSLLKS